MVDDAVKDAIAALLRKRDHLRKNGADEAKLAEMDEQLRLAGHDPDAESKKPAAKTAETKTAAKSAKADDDDDAKTSASDSGAKTAAKASADKPAPKTASASANVPAGRVAPSKDKA